MGMAIIKDDVLQELKKIKARWAKKHPDAKITYSTVIMAGVRELNRKGYEWRKKLKWKK